MIQIFTGTRWNKLSRSLSGIGVVHRGAVVVLIETLTARREDTYHMIYREVETGEVLETPLIGAPPIHSYQAAVFQVTLPPGRWRLELESAWQGLLAWREIRIRQ